MRLRACVKQGLPPVFACSPPALLIHNMPECHDERRVRAFALLDVASFGAEGGGNPIFITLALLTMIVGLPFLVVSTTAPLLQRWFNHTGHPAAKDPYFLYGASNAGSILGLLLYPVAVERFLGLDE